MQPNKGRYMDIDYLTLEVTEVLRVLLNTSLKKVETEHVKGQWSAEVIRLDIDTRKPLH